MTSSANYTFRCEHEIGFDHYTYVNPKAQEVAELVRLAHIFYARIMAQEFATSFKDLNTENPIYGVYHYTFHLQVELVGTFLFAPGFPSFEEALLGLGNFDTDDYVVNFVNLVPLELGYTFAG